MTAATDVRTGRQIDVHGDGAGRTLRDVGVDGTTVLVLATDDDARGRLG